MLCNDAAPAGLGLAGQDRGERVRLWPARAAAGSLRGLPGQAGNDARSGAGDSGGNA